jgi:hypothetical protein
MYKTHNILFKQITKFGFLLIMGLSMTACGAGSKKWKEEVQLSDGKVIVIERELITKGGGDEWASNSGGVMPKEYRIEFNDLNDSGKTIKWISTKKSPATWPEIPLILDVISGQFVVYSSVADPRGCKIYSKYLYRKGTWVEEKLPPIFEQRATNLFVMRKEDFKKFMDLKTKQAIVSKHFSADRSDSYDQVGPTHPNCKGVG